MRFIVEIVAQDGRVEGFVSPDGGGQRRSFSGWLELLSWLEPATATSPQERSDRG